MLKTISLFIFLFIGINIYSQKPNQKLTLESIWNGNFDQRLLNVKIMNQSNKIAFIKTDTNNLQLIITLDFETGRLIDTIFSNQITKSNDSVPMTFTYFEDFEIAPDDSKILIKTFVEPLFTNTTKEACFIWDIKKRELKPVISDGKVSHCTFSPDSKQIAFIFDNNIYIKNLKNNELKKVTIDGKPNEIIYGCANTLYENGFGITKLLQWSANGEKLAFSKIDDRVVKTYPITIFENNYPIVKNTFYPIPGEMVPKIDLYVYNVAFGISTVIDVGINPNQYITGFKINNTGSDIFYQRLNRKQNYMEVLVANTKDGESKVVYKEQKKNYIKTYLNNIFLLGNTTNFLWLSEKDGYSHIYNINTNTGNVNAVTQGNYEVNSIEAIDSITNRVYYSSNQEGITKKDYYSVNINGALKQRLTKNNGNNKIYLAQNFKYYFVEMSSINEPTSYQMYRTSTGELFKKLIENKSLKSTLSNYTIPKIDLVTIPWINNKNRTALYIKGTKIANKKMGTLIYIYGAPTKQAIIDQWNDRTYFALRFLADKGYNIVCIDPLGTPGRGEQFNKASYEKLASIVLDDLEYLRSKGLRSIDNSIDTNNLAIMGWSYGGFVASLAAVKTPDNYKAFIAVAPVTDWQIYDNIFTERYLKQPGEAPENYINNSPISFVNNYKKGLLLIHGTADDNVHFQNSLKMSKLLIQQKKDFDQHFYPDYLHDINDKDPNNCRVHLFQKVLKFLNENLSSK